jgi:hypothetical protein
MDCIFERSYLQLVCVSQNLPILTLPNEVPSGESIGE